MQTRRDILTTAATTIAAVTLATAAAFAQTRPAPAPPVAPLPTDAHKATAPATPAGATAKPAPNLKARGSGGEEDEIQPRSRQDAQRPDKAGGKPLTPTDPLAKPNTSTPMKASRAAPPPPKDAMKW